MPVSSKLPDYDYGKLAVATILPGIGCIVGYAACAKDKTFLDFWARLKKPSWALTEVSAYSAVDMLAALPLGFASYLVYEHGGGFKYDDTKLALGMYGVNMGLSLMYIPLMQKKDLKLSFIVTAATHATAGAVAGLFYKLYPKAGYLAVPWVLLTG